MVCMVSKATCVSPFLPTELDRLKGTTGGLKEQCDL